VIYAEGAACETLRAITAVNSDEVEFERYRTLHPNLPCQTNPSLPCSGTTEEERDYEGAFVLSCRM
jgi:hypothetical protein